MAFLIPALAASSGGLFNAIGRAFKKPEDNFKDDLIELLGQSGLDEDMIARIKDFLGSGDNRDLGANLNALMASGIIPPELADPIAELAGKDNVPSESIDRDRIGEEMSREECRATIGGEFSQELDELDEKDEAAENGEGQDEDYGGG